MLHIGQEVITKTGRKLEVLELLGAGAEGQAHKVVNKRSGSVGVLKIFSDNGNKAEHARRTQYLIGLKLDRRCAVIHAPYDEVDGPDGHGHVSRFADGVDLETFFAGPNPPLVAALQAALVLSHAVTVLHDLNIAHGDLHFRNVRVIVVDDVLKVAVIDVDGFSAPGFASPVWGAPHYMAPELNKALLERRDPVVTLQTDRYSLAMLLHELLLWAHIASGCGSEDEVRDAMYSGTWAFDPLHRKTPVGIGLPAEILTPRTRLLFKRAISLDPDDRPTAHEWKEELLKGLWAVWVCPFCGGPVVIDESKLHCPFCSKAYPALGLRLANGARVRFENGVTELRRSTLGGAATLSEVHGVIRRRGPEYWLEPRGRNGTWREAGSSWVQLANGKEVLLRAGNRLRFADVEASVVVTT